MTDRLPLGQHTDVLPADRLRSLIDRACHHLTPQEANALRGAAAGTMRNATSAVAELHQRLAEQAADLERARRIAVALENELAAAQHQTAIDVQVMEKADRECDEHIDAGRKFWAVAQEWERYARRFYLAWKSARRRAARAEAERAQHAAILARVTAECDRIAQLPAVANDSGRADTFDTGSRWTLRMIRTALTGTCPGCAVPGCGCDNAGAAQADAEGSSTC